MKDGVRDPENHQESADLPSLNSGRRWESIPWHQILGQSLESRETRRG
jgi:hypothetical protein